MNSFSTIEKYAIIKALSQIMKADGIIHPKEEEYMDKVFAELGITIGDMEDITNMDDIQVKSVISAIPDEKKQYVQSLFVSMAEADGHIHPLETKIIYQLWKNKSAR